MARPKGITAIGTWLEAQSPGDQQTFRDYARAHYHDKPGIQAYLTARGCDVALSTVHNWIAANIQPGEQAALFNRDNQDYIGVELLPIVEKLSVHLAKVMKKFYEVLDHPDLELTPEQALISLPTYARELRSALELINKLKTKADFEQMTLAGGYRVMEIIMGLAGVKDTAEETFFRQTLESALIQLHEEVKRKTE